MEQVGKKFNRQWLFKDINYTFDEHKSYAIIGNNGSGKSTLLQLIYGFQTTSIGNIVITQNQQTILPYQVHLYAAFVAPYLELLEEFTLYEMLMFHFQFKEKSASLSVDEMIEISNLQSSKNKQIKLFSSGMKQRLKLALTFFSNAPLLLLDEPCSNLDAQGIEWYHEMIKNVIGKRTVIIASNQNYEYDFCDAALNIADFRHQ